MTVPLSSAQNSKRLKELLQTNKWIVAAELIVLCALCFARLFPFSIQIFLLAFSSLSLWLRGLSWRDVGLRSKAWWKVALMAVLAALLIAIVVNLVTAPFVQRFVSGSANNSRFANIRG